MSLQELKEFVRDCCCAKPDDGEINEFIRNGRGGDKTLPQFRKINQKEEGEPNPETERTKFLQNYHERKEQEKNNPNQNQNMTNSKSNTSQQQTVSSSTAAAGRQSSDQRGTDSSNQTQSQQKSQNQKVGFAESDDKQKNPVNQSDPLSQNMRNAAPTFAQPVQPMIIPAAKNRIKDDLSDLDVNDEIHMDESDFKLPDTKDQNLQSSIGNILDKGTGNSRNNKKDSSGSTTGSKPSSTDPSSLPSPKNKKPQTSDKSNNHNNNPPGGPGPGSVSSSNISEPKVIKKTKSGSASSTASTKLKKDMLDDWERENKIAELPPWLSQGLKAKAEDEKSSGFGSDMS